MTASTSQTRQTPPNNLPSVSLLGTGTMGSAMAGCLLQAGLETVVWDRSAEATSSLGNKGAVVAGTPREAVGRTDVVITMLSTIDAIESVIDDDVLGAMRPHAIWSQMGTIGPEATEHLLERANRIRSDVFFVDAPVSGSKGPAQSGELMILASGPPEAAPRLGPVYSAIGRRTMWLGDAGRGSRLKLVLNTWLAFLIEGVAEADALAQRIGVTRHEFIDALDGSPLAAGIALAKLRKIDTGDFAPEFALAWALKDVDLALTFIGDGQLPATEAISHEWHAAVDQGFGRLDVSASVLPLRTRSSIQ
jgi:3-hydroxyisobutyrate dehydrogenase